MTVRTITAFALLAATTLGCACPTSCRPLPQAYFPPRQADPFVNNLQDGERACGIASPAVAPLPPDDPYRASLGTLDGVPEAAFQIVTFPVFCMGFAIHLITRRGKIL